MKLSRIPENQETQDAIITGISQIGMSENPILNTRGTHILCFCLFVLPSFMADDDEFKRYCLMRPRGQVHLEYQHKNKRKHPEYNSPLDIPKPLYFVTVHPIFNSEFEIYDVDEYAKTEPTVRKAKRKNGTAIGEFKWMANERQWVMVEPGTRRRVKDGPIVLSFYMMKDIEKSIFNETRTQSGNPEQRFKYTRTMQIPL
jgi:hypothetical protein